MSKAEAMMKEVFAEYKQAKKLFGDFNNSHEGYAVILEELDELWEAIKSKDKTLDDQRKEAIQVTAMGLRFLVDLCNEHPY